MYKDVHIYRFWLNSSIDEYTFKKYQNLESMILKGLPKLTFWIVNYNGNKNVFIEFYFTILCVNMYLKII